MRGDYMESAGNTASYSSSYDGFIDFEIHEDGLYLLVFAPQGEGRKITIEEVVDTLGRRGIKEYNLDEVKLAVNSTMEKAVRKISDQTELTPINESITVEIAKNKMFAAIVFTPPENGGKSVTAEDILSNIERNGITFGINHQEIKEAVEEKRYYHKYLVAQGIEAVHGENGTLEFHFNAEKRDIKPKIRDDGTVDFHNLDLIEIVMEGQILVTMIPPKEGITGMNILGKEIVAAKGKKAILPKGKNVKISEDGLQLIAEISGQVNMSNGKVNIYPTYEAPANVDNSTGDISFIGNVVVKGNVITGFSINAGGNVEVHGVVEGAAIRAEGDIILHRGMQGMGKGVLIAGGNVVAKYIENSSVSATGDVQCEAVMHSNIRCGGSLEVNGKKGLLVGGVVKAGKEVVAKVIGSPMATITEIEVGIDPTILERYKSIKQELTELKKELVKTEQVIDLLNRAKEANKLTDDKRDMLVKSIRTKVFLSNKLTSVKNEINEIEPQLEEKDDGKVRSYGIIHPGVKVTIGTACMYVREDLKYCSLYKDKADIRLGSYE